MTTACSAPQFTYVTNSADHTYFKVPHGWHEINQSSLSREVSIGSQSGSWSVAYDDATAPSAAHLFADATGRPFAWALVENLTSAQRNSISYDGLRNFILPVTSSARQSATSQSGGFALTHFQSLSDTVLTPGQGIRGVRVIYDYQYPDGTVETFDQVAYMNANASQVYVLFMHCTDVCYAQDEGQIDTIMKSFTVRSH